MSSPRNPRSVRVAIGTLLIATAMSAGCAPAVSGGPNPDDPNNPGEPVTYELKQPTLINIAPTEVSLGEEVKVFGKDFIDDKHGELRLHYKGSYRNAAGGEPSVE